MKKILALSLLAVICFSGCADRDFKRTRVLMGTLVKISVTDRDKSSQEVNRAVNKAFEEIEKIDRLMSIYRIDSQVSKINRLGKGQMLAVNDELLEVIKRSLGISRMSSGAFDLTCGALIELWGFGKGKKREDLPSSEEIDSALSTVGYQQIIIDQVKKRIGFKRENMKINLGAAAKGYAIDKAIEVLKGEGINNALVDAGGDIYCLGLNSRGLPWVVGVKNPRNPKQVITALELSDRACATSGGYEKFFLKDKQRFSHLIDPRTGRPVQNKLVSVTVLAADCFEADSLATAVFVLGKEKGLKLIDSLAETEAIIISQDAGQRMTYFSNGLCFLEPSN